MGEQESLGLDAVESFRIRSGREVIMKLKVLIRSESVGGYSVSVPALPGCYSQGETLKEALENIREAAELWLEVASDTAAAQAGEENVGAQFQEIDL
jgi:predicted RNase H-like HicB family nuclease